jgi:cytochrome P450
MLSMHTILLTFIIVPTIYVCHSLILLYRSYRHFSRTLPIPLIAVPIEPSTIAAQTFLPILFSITDRFISRSNYPIWIVPLRAGWQHVDATSTRIFSRGSWWYGKGDDRPLPAIGVISPAGLNVHICDPNAIVQMLEARDRGNGYGVARDPAMYSVLALYGPCLSTAENQDWPRHRKALAPPFNESVMAEVWDETRAQARGLVNAWSGAGHDGVACLATDLRTLALNVLAAVGFRKSTTFVSAVEKGEQDILIREAMTFRDALAAVLDNALLLLVIPMRLLVWPMWPKRMQMLGKVGMQLKQHMDKMLDDELASADRGDKSSGGIMSALLNALRTNLEQNKASAGATGSLAQGLTKEECCGNIFIVNFAGHDTVSIPQLMRQEGC